MDYREAKHNTQYIHNELHEVGGGDFQRLSYTTLIYAGGVQLTLSSRRHRTMERHQTTTQMTAIHTNYNVVSTISRH